MHRLQNQTLPPPLKLTSPGVLASDPSYFTCFNVGWRRRSVCCGREPPSWKCGAEINHPQDWGRTCRPAPGSHRTVLAKSESVPVRMSNPGGHADVGENKTELTSGLCSEAVVPLTTNYLDNHRHSKAGGRAALRSQGVYSRGAAVSR